MRKVEVGSTIILNKTRITDVKAISKIRIPGFTPYATIPLSSIQVCPKSFLHADFYKNNEKHLYMTENFIS